ncbi:MAG: hypothetical protein JWR80_10062 [Bradyrhizobium sp.]|nr:hypothetical protein [Bradyrhizobium sp.]
MTVYEGPSVASLDRDESIPLFNPIKPLADALTARGVSVAPLLRVEGGSKFGMPGVRQFVCTSPDDFPALADKIAEVGKVVRFMEMVVPRRGVIGVSTFQFADLWVRQINDYQVQTDQIISRWDVLVEAV